MSESDHPAEVMLRRDGVCLVLQMPAADEPGLPRLLHWGTDLGTLDAASLTAIATATEPAVPRNALDAGWPLTVLPTQAEGWLGRPGLAAHRSGRVIYPRWTARLDDARPHRVTILAEDAEAGIAVVSFITLRSGGLLGVRHRVRNLGPGELEITRLEALLPIPDAATEVLDLTGRWAKERVPQRAELQFGSRVRESRRGRTGHDAATTLYAGTPGFAHRSGDVWGVHVATSGNHVHAVERLPEGAGGSAAVLGGGELLEPGEMVLAPEHEYAGPWAWFVHSSAGLDGAAARFHTYLRTREHHPRQPRPLVLNTWEAVYLDHDHDRLLALASCAADVGVERFVLDDGWFHGRPGTTRRGLGDWWVDEQAWPDGLDLLTEHVRGLGMQFGLWVEPEMVNADSELVRRHPDWVLAAPGRWPRTARHQFALDIVRPEVSDYLAEAIGSLVERYDIAFLKWDHNRDLHEAVHQGIAGVHRQTQALYVLLDRLRRTHPGLEIEACASGGARVDLGIVQHTDRVWVSDTNDPLERQRIQYWTSQLLPLELQGTHIGPPRAHTTGRWASLQFRALTALFGHAGIEWDITACTDAELRCLRAWAQLYRELRPLLHGGLLVRPDHADPHVLITGVVAPDRARGVYLYARTDTSVAAAGERLRLEGLKDTGQYRVTVRNDLGEPPTMHVTSPGWMVRPVVLPGVALRTVGLAAPQLLPQEAMLLMAEEIAA